MQQIYKWLTEIDLAMGWNLLCMDFSVPTIPIKRRYTVDSSAEWI